MEEQMMPLCLQHLKGAWLEENSTWLEENRSFVLTIHCCCCFFF